MSQARRLHAIVEGEAHGAIADLRDMVAVNVVNVRDIASVGIAADDSILIDADLRDSKRANFLLAHLPRRRAGTARIILVDLDNPASIAQANAMDASDLVGRPLDARDLRRRLERHFGAPADEPRFRSAASSPGGASIDSAAATLDRMFDALNRGGAIDVAAAHDAGDQVIDAIGDVGLSNWLATVRQYHEGTFQHCLIVTGVTTSFARRIGLRRSDIQTLTMAGLLHDVGKAGIPVAILDKPGRLTADEFAIIQSHPSIGYDHLRSSGGAPDAVLAAVRHHHEYLDGSGYPDGLSAAQINDVTRILTICDVYGALVEERAYKPPKSHDEAMAILLAMARDGKIEESLVRAFGSA